MTVGDIAYNSRLQFTLHLKILDVANEHIDLCIVPFQIRVSEPALPIHQTVSLCASMLVSH
ncbi:hypothetical protein [Nostoc sp.]|uniref:hypothetical protein n=1 Tax=Nostoc sp. TaxID=1180 RepID=UPI002FFBFCBB